MEIFNHHLTQTTQECNGESWKQDTGYWMEVAFLESCLMGDFSNEMGTSVMF